MPHPIAPEPGGGFKAFARLHWRRVASTLLVIGFLGWLAFGSGVDLRGVLRSIQRFPLAAVGAALGLGILQNLCQASRLWALLPEHLGVRWWPAVRAFYLGQVVNNYVPARAGDVVKIALIRRLTPADEPGAATSNTTAKLVGAVLVADKLVDLGALVLLVALMAPGWLREVPLPRPTSALGWLGAAGAVALIVGALVFGARRLPQRARAALAGVVEGAQGLRRGRTALRAIVISCGAWLSEAVMVSVLAAAAGYGLSIPQSLGVLVVVNLGVAIPLSFANIGTFEAAAVFGLSRFGVSVDAALAVATVHHLVQALSLLLLAALAWAVKPAELRRRT